MSELIDLLTGKRMNDRRGVQKALLLLRSFASASREAEPVYAEKQMLFSISDYKRFLFPYVTPK